MNAGMRTQLARSKHRNQSRRRDIEWEEAGKYRVTLIWERGGEISDDYRFGLALNGLRWGPFYFARGADPSSYWESNQFYRDEVEIVVPKSERANPRSLTPVLLK